MLKTCFRFSFAAYFLCGAHQNTNKEKPEILVEQTLYIILLAKIDTAACGDAGVVRSVLLRILPRMFFPFCLPRRAPQMNYRIAPSGVTVLLL